MTQAIVNLALPVIEKKVKAVLANSAAPKPSGTTIALQEKLVAYVARRMPTLYVMVDSAQTGSTENSVSCFSQAQHQEMDQLIDEGLQHLTTWRSNWESAAQESAGGFGPAPSHWFG